jgi:GNAT superfamily N-acetyltransferase
VEFATATADRWADVDRLFAGCGDARRCWCGFLYRSRAEFLAGWQEGGAGNRNMLRGLVEGGAAPGVLAYRDGEVAGWCGVAPRAAQARLARSRVLAPVDDVPVWSITCFVIARPQRRRGLMRPLIDAAVDHARAQGAAMVEAYPLDAQRKLYPGELFVGTLNAFLASGFREVARRSPTRPIVRLSLHGDRAARAVGERGS